jgi:hypothetical protein
MTEESEFESWCGQESQHCPDWLRDRTQSHIQWVPWLKQPGPEADLSSSSDAEVKKTWLYTSTPAMCLHGIVLNQLSRGTTLPFLFLYTRYFLCVHICICVLLEELVIQDIMSCSLVMLAAFIMLICSLFYFSTLKIEVICSFKTPTLTGSHSITSQKTELFSHHCEPSSPVYVLLNYCVIIQIS